MRVYLWCNATVIIIDCNDDTDLVSHAVATLWSLACLVYLYLHEGIGWGTSLLWTCGMWAKRKMGCMLSQLSKLRIEAFMHLRLDMWKPTLCLHEQQSCACASVQSDQHLCCSLLIAYYLWILQLSRPVCVLSGPKPQRHWFSRDVAFIATYQLLVHCMCVFWVGCNYIYLPSVCSWSVVNFV